MLFNSFIFVGLCLATFIIYYLPLLSRFQVMILILSSLVFYAYNNPTLVFLLLFSAGLNTIMSYYIVRGKTSWRRTFVVTGVTLNLAVLSFFKYSSLISRSFFSSNDSIG